MFLNKIKAMYSLLTGGVTGLIKYSLTAFNTKVLGKIKDKESAAKYLKDAKATYAFVGALIVNHADDLTPAKKAAADATLAAMQEFTNALEDFEVNKKEFDRITDKIKACIDAWKAAK